MNEGKEVVGLMSMSEMANRADIPDGSGPYRLDYLLGADRFLEGVPVGPGFKAAFEVMMGGLTVSGSSLTSDLGTAESNIGEESTFIQALQPLLDRRINPDTALVDPEKLLPDMNHLLRMTYYEGAYKLDKLENLSYFGLHLLLSFGSNIDLFGKDRMHDAAGSSDRLISLLRASDMYMIMGWPRVVSQLEFHGRFKVSHIEGDRNSISGGVNVMCFPNGWHDSYTDMLSFRRDAQTASVLWDQEEGIRAVVNREAASQPITMTGTPKTMGEWLMFTARALRVAAIHGPDDFQIDTASFLKKRPKGNEFSFEQVIGIVGNMVTAYWHNPHEVGNLIKALRLEEYFGKANDAEMRTGLELAERELFGELHEPGNPYKGSWEIDKEVHGFGRIADLTPLISRFMPVTLEAFDRLVPKKHDREKIECRLGGNNGTIPFYNPDAIGDYLVNGVVVRATRTYMDAYLAMGEVLEWARTVPGRATEQQISAMEKDMEVLAYGAGLKDEGLGKDIQEQVVEMELVQ